jgi:SAM-dependent methyltransferase
MNRREKLLHQLPVADLLGVEIGPLCRPVVRRTDGRVYYSDYLSTAELHAKYRDDPLVDVGTMVDVDIVTAQGQSLADAYRFSERPDYVLASHLIEHVPDLIGWLASLRRLLKANGQVRLAVPDRRFTFDLLRSETRLCDVALAHLMQTQVPLPHVVIDHTFNMAKVDALDAWQGKINPDRLEKYHDPATVLHFARDALHNQGYHDVHCWTFTPHSFAVLFEQMAELDLLQFACDGCFETAFGEIEFFVTLRGCDDKAEISRSWRAMRDGLDAAVPKPATPASTEGLELQRPSRFTVLQHVIRRAAGRITRRR